MSVSPLETLPVELLQPIFFASGHNVALLHASDRISARLSSDFVYTSTCNHYLKNILEDRISQAAAQTSIFASKWMTWAFFKSWVIKTYEPSGCLCGLTPDDGCFDAQWPPNFDNATEMVFSRSHLPRLAFIKARIPKKLLRGPWTPDTVQFLQFLLWITSMTVNWSDSESRQDAIDGRARAIRERNLEAVELFNHNRRLGKVASLETVRFAVLEGGCDRSIVYDTMFTIGMWGPNVALDCDELDRWCEERMSEGNPKGQWLKTKLEELRATRVAYKGTTVGYLSPTGGELDSDAGDYDGGATDRLVVKQHKWNQPRWTQSQWRWRRFRLAYRRRDGEWYLLRRGKVHCLQRVSALS
ncbi:hypothetical protein CC86DRAFT_154578 [Ophiobolus disseminans]|uniref:Uncharacterized protein n=1 Tax=Ophiobolus disseminans TaxID=1469910 RepID=A0A6A6ZEB6_9PLEO|nr:hypothetical protein CC86DRAFT_154578 [Ophiobolus disseminans]